MKIDLTRKTKELKKFKKYFIFILNKTVDSPSSADEKKNVSNIYIAQISVTLILLIYSTIFSNKKTFVNQF